MMYDVLLSGIKMIHVAEHFKWIHAVILIFVVHSKVASTHICWVEARGVVVVVCIHCVSGCNLAEAFLHQVEYMLSKSWQGKHKTVDENAQKWDKKWRICPHNKG